MPLVYRPMKKDDDDLPLCGSMSKELGVRIPPSDFADIDVSDSAMIELNGRGMSVGRHWTMLPAHLIPQRLASSSPGATGSNRLACFRFGSGDFTEGELTDDLQLVLKPGQIDRGNVVPGRAMNVDEFQEALAATREQWEIDEELL